MRVGVGAGIKLTTGQCIDTKSSWFGIEGPARTGTESLKLTRYGFLKLFSWRHESSSSSFESIHKSTSQMASSTKFLPPGIFGWRDDTTPRSKGFARSGTI